jgi:hypothetical protein
MIMPAVWRAGRGFCKLSRDRARRSMNAANGFINDAYAHAKFIGVVAAA